jgi:MarR family transcriptional regulator, organic hydroperoxide resistance regulator
MPANNKESPVKVCDCIFFQLTKASQAGAGFWAKKVEHLGVTASQAMVLNFLGEEDRILSRVLRHKLQITSATMTGILDRLEKLVLIERQPHPDDRRAILVCLTARGSRYAKDINRIMVGANEEFLSRFNTEKAQSFREMLKRVHPDTHSPDNQR